MQNSPTRKPWPLSSIVLVIAGLALVGTGLYFIIIRPPLLPEDYRYMALNAAQLDPVRPRLEPWLAQVFEVMGGYILATGVLTITIAATSFRQHDRVAALGVLIGGAASIGLVAAVNFAIDSNFKWALLVIALVWTCSLVLFWSEARSQRSRAKDMHGETL